jgi:undecaprenyl-diphosphatase
VLVPWLLGWKEPGVAFDAILHLGTLLAVIAFFWRDLLQLLKGAALSVKERSLADDPWRKVAWLILLGTVPAAVIGFLLQDFFEALFSAPAWVAVLLIITGVILAVTERWGGQRLKMHDLGWLDAVLIGLAQAAAIAPGISRSGATIGAGLWRGLEREAAARLSFLLATPIILGTGLFKLKELSNAAGASGSAAALLVGFVVAAISGFLSIKLLLRYLQRRRLYPFAAYCWAVGATTLALSLLCIR